MEIVEQKVHYAKSKFSILQKHAFWFSTSFTHTYLTLEQQRRQVVIGHEVISNKMVYKYL